MSEIDAIFSLDGSKATTSQSAVAGPSAPKKKKESKSKQVASSSLAESVPSLAATASNDDRKKKRKRVEAVADAPVAPSKLPTSDKKSSSKPKKVKEAVTILDPSVAIEAPANGSGSKSKSKKARPIANGKMKEPPADLESFTNSRGAGREYSSYVARFFDWQLIIYSTFSPTGSRTEEGFAIYSENELKLDQGGDTPLCPFDCDCCESKV